MTDYTIQTKNLCKKIAERDILSDVSIHVKKGEIYGFLGANGAGKTTLMKALLRLITPSSGTILLFGCAVADNDEKIFSRIGNIIETPVFYQNLTAAANLELHCDYMGLDYQNIAQALETTGLADTESKKVKNFSLGMKQRLALARAFLSKPELLILDEPINGLDPKGISEIRDLLLEINKENGTTIIISSHILSEVEKIADTIGIIDKGRVLAELSMSHIKEKNVNLEDYYLKLLEERGAALC